MKIGIIGFGRMGGAIAKGLLAAKIATKNTIVAFDPESGVFGKSAPVIRAASVADVLKKADAVLLCVKPQVMAEALAKISESLNAPMVKGKLFISIAAGITLARLESGIGRNAAVVRAMPNTPALHRMGITAFCAGKSVSAKQLVQAKKILQAIGDAVEVTENLMDAVTAVSGSGPAYVFYLAEAMLAAAGELGLDAATARQLVNQTILGAGFMLANQREAADELRRQVTSPNGTTAAAIATFDDKDLKQIIQMAVKNAARRSAELAKS